jgi:DNA-binding MarR family transcriptional regulator
LNKQIIRKEDLIGYLVNKSAKGISTLFDKLMEKEKQPIRIEQWRLLFVLQEKDFIYQKEITECINRDKTYVTRMVESMVDLGFIERSVDLKDKRNFKVNITPKGIEYINHLLPTIKLHIIDNLIDKTFNQEELILFKSYLNRLNFSIENYINELDNKNE